MNILTDHHKFNRSDRSRELTSFSRRSSAPVPERPTPAKHRVIARPWPDINTGENWQRAGDVVALVVGSLDPDEDMGVT